MADRPPAPFAAFRRFGSAPESRTPANQGDLFSAPPASRAVEATKQPAAPSKPPLARPAHPLRPVGLTAFRPNSTRPSPTEAAPSRPAPFASRPAVAPTPAPAPVAPPAALNPEAARQSPPPADPPAAAPKIGRLKLSSLSTSVEDEAPPILDDMPKPAAPAAPAEPSMVELKGAVQRVIYEGDDGFRVYAIRVNGEDISVQITSPIKANVKDKIVVRGEWGMYKGKRTFKAKLLMQDLPTDRKGVAAWIRTGAVPGVAKATGEKLVKHFGDEILEVIDKPDRLVEAGIPRAKAEAIAEAWTTNAMQPALIAYLGSLGLGEGTITKIIRRYGMTAKQQIEKNPWQLAETIDGVGFQKADEIGRNAGHHRESVDRIRAGISFALNEAVNRDGHTGLPREQLAYRATKLLAIPRHLVEAQIDATLDGGRNLFDEISGLAAPIGINRAEHDLVRHVSRIMDGDGIDEAEAARAIDEAQQKMGIVLDPSQRDAAMLALTNNVSIITGGPGTGKSTTQKVIVNALKSFGKEVMLGAPTGRAAKRLAEVSGLPASTCHRLLQFSAEVGGFSFNEDNPFEEDWTIIDEFSMVDTKLAASFIQAIRTGTGMTIVGDIDQLPSVGAGQVLRDLIETGMVPTARLTTVHRQGKDSGIVTAAHRINTGNHPVPTDEKDLNGFEIHQSGSSADTVERVVDLMSKRLPSLGYDPLKDVQVLAAKRMGDVGVYALNDAIKAVLNPVMDDGRSVTIKGKQWTVGDRVMHIRNDYAKGVYNGEVGVVCRVGQRANEDNGKLEDFIRVDYSGFEANYGARDIEDVEQCWAATVHKSQGCEFPVVIMVCPWEHAHVLNRNLLYTGVTRAKSLCILVGDDLAIGQSAAKSETLKRHTGLPKLLNSISTAPSEDGASAHYDGFPRSIPSATAPDEAEDDDDQYPLPPDEHYSMPGPGGFIQLEE